MEGARYGESGGFWQYYITTTHDVVYMLCSVGDDLTRERNGLPSKVGEPSRPLGDEAFFEDVGGAERIPELVFRRFNFHARFRFSHHRDKPN